MKTGKFEKEIGEKRCREQLVACSTFKVPLAVIGFDSGILKDENTLFKWDGKVDSRKEVNQDHTAKSWIQDSIVWYSQRITRELGLPKLQKYLDDFKYGNRDMTAGLETAWVVKPSSSGPALKISSYEQIEFLKKLWTDKLPVSKRAMKLTRQILVIEKSDKGSVLSGKTGSHYFDANNKQQFGWYTGHLDANGAEYLVVANFADDDVGEHDGYGGMRAKAASKQILADLGLW